MIYNNCHFSNYVAFNSKITFTFQMQNISLKSQISIFGLSNSK